VLFTGSDIFGTARVATFVGASSQSLSSTDAFLKPSVSTSYSVGVWVKATDWTPSAYSVVIDNGYDTSNYGLGIGIQTSGLITFSDSIDSTGANTPIIWSPAMGFVDGSWHHFAMTYDAVADVLVGYIDGAAIGQIPLAKTSIAANQIFRIGARRNTAADFFTGSMADLFFVNGVVFTAQDVRRICSTRIDHNKNLIAKRQDWHFKHQHLGTAGNPYQTLPFVWHDSTDANSLFVDFSDLDATDKIDIRMYDLQQ
jgi:hypothetical protein